MTFHLHIRCDACGAHSPTAAHFEDARLAAIAMGWELDSRLGDLCDLCGTQEQPLVIDQLEELTLPPMGRLIMIGHPGQPSWLDVARVVAVTAVLQLARSRG